MGAPGRAAVPDRPSVLGALAEARRRRGRGGDGADRGVRSRRRAAAAAPLGPLPDDRHRRPRHARAHVPLGVPGGAQGARPRKRLRLARLQGDPPRAAGARRGLPPSARGRRPRADRRLRPRAGARGAVRPRGGPDRARRAARGLARPPLRRRRAGDRRSGDRHAGHTGRGARAADPQALLPGALAGPQRADRPLPGLAVSRRLRDLAAPLARLRQLRRHRLLSPLLRTGDERGGCPGDHGRGLARRHPVVRHGRCLRRRPQRGDHRPLALRAPAGRPADHDEGRELGPRRPGRPRARARPDQARARGQPRAARRRPDRPLPGPRAGSGDAARGHGGDVRGAGRRGAIGAWGLSNFDAAGIEEALAHGRPALVQNAYSLLNREDERDVLPLCAAHGIAYAPFGPLAGGWLTGKYTRGAAFPEGSRMTKRPEPYERFVDDRIYDGLDLLAAEAASRGVDLPTLAFAWVLSIPRSPARSAARRARSTSSRCWRRSSSP